MQIGDRVRVIGEVIVHHHPEHRNQPLNIKGLQGNIKALINEWKGQTISPNYPYLVEFDKKFRAHLQASELEAL